MNYKEIETNEQKYIKDIPNFNVGDTIAVSTIVREGDKKRTQVFKGLVLAMKGSGIRKTFTIRKISNGIGVEKIIPLNSPNISKLKMIKKGNVRKSKLYYMRDRIGKKALKVKERLYVPTTATKVEPQVDVEPEVKE